MTAALLSVHVVLAVLAIGPVTVAASTFGPTARAALAAPPAAEGPAAAPAQAATLRVLHRITRTYAAVGLAVPAFGVVTAARLGVLTDLWVLTAVALTVAAAVVLVARVLPGQRQVLAALQDPGPARPLAPAGTGTGTGTAVATVEVPLQRVAAGLTASTGVFNALWVTVVVLMIIRPGSSTGV